MFTLRGLCPELLDKVDTKYTVDTAFLRENIHLNIAWTGFQKSKISLDMETNLWTITGATNDGLMKMKSKVSQKYLIKSFCSDHY